MVPSKKEIVGLKKIGLLELTFYAIGLILGAGIYVIIGKAAGLAGNSLWLSFLLGAVIASLSGLSFAELSSMFPKASSIYSYMKGAFERKVFSFLVAWLYLCSGIIGAATVISGFSYYFKAITGIPLLITSLALLSLLSFFNFLGIRESAILNLIFTLIEISGLLIVIIAGLPKIWEVNLLKSPYGIYGILAATSIAFFAYLGFEGIVTLSEEVYNARINVPKALLISLLVTSLLYILTGVSCVSLVHWKKLAESNAPLAYAISATLGKTSYFLLSVIALFATFNTALTLLISTSRMLYGLACERIMPSFLAEIHAKRGTPSYAIFAISLATLPFLFLPDIKFLASLTNFSAFLIFCLANISVIILRIKKPELERPFKVPLSIRNIPIPSVLGFLTSLLLLFHLEMNSILAGAVFLLLGFIIYKVLKSLM